MGDMKIGALASSTGVAPATIRFYEAEGLMPAPDRTAGNYRDYGSDHAERLHFIRRCRSLGMELGEIRSLLRFKDAPGDDCAGVNALLEAHLGHVGERIRELRQLEEQLRALRDRCRGIDGTERCGILQELARGQPAATLPAGRHVRGAHR
jgi:Cd(II)/Pb(II)-responsive transcriptional regulator